MEEDLGLIERFKEGALEGFEMLVKKYHNRVVNIAYSLVGNLSDAEDIAQETFIKVYHSLNTFKAQAKFSSWLYRITMNTAYDLLRRNKHKAAQLDDIDLSGISDKKDPADILSREVIQDALDKLPYNFRSTLVLREIEGLSYEEISQALNISIGTVESRISRARCMLKKILIKRGIKNV
jgi:RNA polymerase sigma-70 factor (ECF subfamily)